MTTQKTLLEWEDIFKNFLLIQTSGDAAHSEDHIFRVVKNAKLLALEESASLEVVIPAAWLHDCVTVPKTSPLRSQASALCAEKASQLLSDWRYQAKLIPSIAHAIHAHSFSAQIEPQSIEAKVVQDADRLDALGAIGLSRCLMLGGELKKPLFHSSDPFCDNREPDDSLYVIDHLYKKLFKLEGMMQTNAGRREAQRRTEVLKRFITDLKIELS
jgi:uncharacterized protein